MNDETEERTTTGCARREQNRIYAVVVTPLLRSTYQRILENRKLESQIWFGHLKTSIGEYNGEVEEVDLGNNCPPPKNFFLPKPLVIKNDALPKPNDVGHTETAKLVQAMHDAITSVHDDFTNSGDLAAEEFKELYGRRCRCRSGGKIENWLAPYDVFMANAKREIESIQLPENKSQSGLLGCANPSQQRAVVQVLKQAACFAQAHHKGIATDPNTYAALIVGPGKGMCACRERGSKTIDQLTLKAIPMPAVLAASRVYERPRIPPGGPEGRLSQQIEPSVFSTCGTTAKFTEP